MRFKGTLDEVAQLLHLEHFFAAVAVMAIFEALARLQTL